MTVRDAGLIQGWDLQGSPEDTRNIYARVVHETNMTLCNSVAVDHIDMALFNEPCDPPDPSSSSVIVRTFDLASEDENPFNHELGLG